MAQYGWKYSFARCTGCRGCVVACRMEQNWPERVKYRWVVDVERGSYPDVSRRHFSSACYHCEAPACMAACDAVGANAITKDPTYGAVIIDQGRCIGCRHCIHVCPYGAPQWNEETQTAYKCDLCIHRLDEGMLPACVDTCVGEALRLDEVAGGPAGDVSVAEDLGFANVNMTGPNVTFD